MRAFKQTTLSFGLNSKKSGAASPSSAQNPHLATAEKTLSLTPQRSKKPIERDTMEIVELPPLPKRGMRSIHPATPKAPPTRALKTNATSSSARKPSLKRKTPTTTITDLSAEREIVHLPASSHSGQSSRQGPFLSVDNKLAAAGKRKGLSPRKKMRMSSPMSDLTPLPPSSVQGTDADDVNFVPTSQSEEQELVLPKIVRKDPVEIQKNVDIWRKETLANSPCLPESPHVHNVYSPVSNFSEIPMDVDFDTVPSEMVPETPIADASTAGLALQYPHTPCSGTGASLLSMPSHDPNATHLQTPSRKDEEQRVSIPNTSPSDAFRSLTPPPSSPDTDERLDQETVPTVQALDMQTKTAQLIADIKARAFAAAHSSPEPSMAGLDITSETDSDSDSSDEIDVAALIHGSRGRVFETPGKPGSSKAEAESTSRYNLRRTLPSSTKKTPASPVINPKARKGNPLDSLLREKKREDRTGTGMAAVRLAEEGIAKKAPLQGEMDGEEDSSDSEMEWEYDRAAATQRKGKSKKGGSSNTTRRHNDKDESDDDEDRAVALMDYQQFLGKKDGEAVGKILANDLKEKMAQTLADQTAEPLGVPLWATALVHSGAVDEVALPLFTADVGRNLALQMLKEATSRNDINQVTALLTSGLVVFLDQEQWPSVIPWLLDTAFSNVTALATLAFTQLLRLAPRVGRNMSGIRLSYILSSLIRLGASSDVLKSHACISGGGMVLQQAINSEWRDEMTTRLITVIDAYAGTFMAEDLCDLLFVSSLVGMDPATPEALQSNVRKTCESLAQVMSPFQQLAVCKRMVAFGKTLSPINQSYLISFLPRISPATSRMSRCIARSLLLDTMPSTNEWAETLPDLLPIVRLLSPVAGSGGYFDILGNSEREGYYDALTCRLSLLSCMLSDIDEYTVAEILQKRAQEQEKKKASTSTTSKEDPEGDNDDNDKEPKLTALEQITRQLDLLHGKIVDTRAAHLDRSRAKAALQRLSLRIHYQRAATTKSGVGLARPRNLFGYFHNPS